MTPREFIEKWRDNPLKERASYQMHFLDLCALLGVDPPAPASHETYCFERGATRTGAGRGWADVWKRGCFGFEYKALHRSLAEALKQLMTYALALDNPPLLVVCDTNLIEIHTHFTSAPSEIHTIAQITEEAAGKFAALAQSLNGRGHEPQQACPEHSRRVAHFLNQCLFCLFAEDAELLPGRLFERLLDKSQTDPAKLSSRFEELFRAMRKGGDFALEDIHWFNGGLFEDIEALPLATTEIKILHDAARLDWSGIEPSIFGTLFERGLDPKKRAQLGAHYTDAQSILRIIVPVIVEPLAKKWEVARAGIADKIAGRKKKGDKAERDAQAMFTAYLERLKAFRILDPACGSGNFLYLAMRALKDLEHRANLDAEALGLQRQITIECSPANVLGIEISPYAAELARVTVWIGEIQWMLKNGYPIRKNPILQPLDHIENRDALLAVIPAQVGIQPIETLDSRLRGNDKIAVEARWPTADAIIGNPPFLGGSKMRGELGDKYTDTLRKVYEGRVPGGADLVAYWFEKARAQIESGNCQRAGLVATNSIRGGANQQVLARILNTAVIPAQSLPQRRRGAGIQPIEKLDSGLRRITSDLPACGFSRMASSLTNDQAMHIFNAWSDEEWVNEGAAVRVSLVCFGATQIPPNPPFAKGGIDGAATSTIEKDKPAPPFVKGGLGGIYLDGHPVSAIHADLTAGEGLNLTQAKPLQENAGVSFQGSQKIGAFDIEGELARQWLKLPNPNRRPNNEVLKPSWNGLDVARRPRDGWIVDFGTTMSEADAALYEAPFAYVTQHVKPEREKNNREVYRKYWWRHGEPRIAMRAALEGLPRYIATPHVSKHRVFIWLDAGVLPDKMLIVIASSDDATFGILHSRFHELWALRMGTSLEDRPRYTPTTTFETFPFPPGLTPADTAPSPSATLPPLPMNGERVGVRGEIATAAQTLNQLRDNWLNPPEWTDWARTTEEEKAGYPLRPIAKPGHEADLKKRTLTNLYNARPAWLDNAHKALDAAVAKAYGWNDYTPKMPDEEILRRLLALNLAQVILS